MGHLTDDDGILKRSAVYLNTEKMGMILKMTDGGEARGGPSVHI